MFSHRFHRYSQMFLSKQKSVLIRVICGRFFLYAYYANCRSYSFLYTKKALM